MTDTGGYPFNPATGEEWPSREVWNEKGNFGGFLPNECGEHRTVGSHRAWCYGDSEWCYPKIPCRGCEISVLRTENQRLRGSETMWRNVAGDNEAEFRKVEADLQRWHQRAMDSEEAEVKLSLAENSIAELKEENKRLLDKIANLKAYIENTESAEKWCLDGELTWKEFAESVDRGWKKAEIENRRLREQLKKDEESYETLVQEAEAMEEYIPKLQAENQRLQDIITTLSKQDIEVYTDIADSPQFPDEWGEHR